MKLRRFSLIMAVAVIATASCYGQRLETTLDDGNPVINCTGMPAATYVQVSKGKTEAELKTAAANGTLFKRFAVSKSDNSSAATWANAFTICSNLGTGWRLPVQRELMLMWLLKKPLEKSSGFSTFANGQYWCATEIRGSEGLICDFTNGYAAGQPKSLTKRVRCIWEVGPRLKLSTSGPGAVVSKDGATYYVNVSSNSSWAAVSSYPGIATISPSSGTGNVNNVRITIAASTSPSDRSVNVVFSTAADPVSGAKATQTWAGTQAGIAIKINGLWWAPGNLVADGANGCKIGAPTDGGLYFQFGSLIGWKGGATGDGTGRAAKADGTYYNGASFSASNEVQVVPAPFTAIGNIGTTWPNQTTNLYYFGLQTPPYATAGTNIQDYPGFLAGSLASSGVGDPCRYYLGDAWRLPTYTEINAMHGAATSKTYPGSWVRGASTDSYVVFTFSGGTELRFPAVGLRHMSYGEIYIVGNSGWYWSSSVDSSGSGYNMGFGDGNVSSQSTYARRTGCSVRCVSN